MIEDINRNLMKYKKRGTIIDSNLLLLYFVGACDEDRISSFKRTNTYTKDDYSLLCRYIEQFKEVLTTPQILTEVSGFLNQLGSDLKPSFYKTFSEQVESFRESYRESKVLSKSSDFIKYGLTDTGIIEGAMENEMLVLTDDFRLSGYLNSLKIDAINFNNIRMLGWK